MRRIRIEGGTQHLDERTKRSSKVGIHVLRLPDGTRSLDFLEPVTAALTELRVSDPGCRDATILSRCTQLRALDIERTSPTRKVDFSALTLLESYCAPDRAMYRSALSLPRLRVVALKSPTPASLELLPEGVEWLRLLLSRRIDSLPAHRTWPRLRELRISDIPHFDASSLKACPNLTFLRLDTVSFLGNVAALVEAGLATLELEQIRSVDDVDALWRIGADSIRLVGPRFPVSRSEVAESGVLDSPRWHLPPLLVPRRSGTDQA